MPNNPEQNRRQYVKHSVKNGVPLSSAVERFKATANEFEEVTGRPISESGSLLPHVAIAMKGAGNRREKAAYLLFANAAMKELMSVMKRDGDLPQKNEEPNT